MGDGTSAKALNANEAREAIAGQESGAIGVIDIRSADEFGEGHIAGATNVEDGDTDSVRATIKENDEAERWLIVCGDGERSSDIASELAGGDADVAYLEGGFESWVGDKLPLQPPPAESEFEGPKKKALY